MGRRTRRMKRAKPQPVNAKQLPADGRDPPNHVATSLATLKYSGPDGRARNVFIRYYPRFPEAENYYPDNPRGAMFGVTCLDPFQLVKQLQANQTLRLAAQTAYREGQKRRPSADALQEIRGACQTLLQTALQKLEPHLGLIYEYVLVEMVQELQDAADRARRKQWKENQRGEFNPGPDGQPGRKVQGGGVRAAVQ